MIDALVNAGIPAVSQADVHGAMRADIQRNMDLTIGGSCHNHLILTHQAHNIIADIGNFSIIAEIISHALAKIRSSSNS